MQMRKRSAIPASSSYHTSARRHVSEVVGCLVSPRTQMTMVHSLRDFPIRNAVHNSVQYDETIDFQVGVVKH